MSVSDSVVMLFGQRAAKRKHDAAMFGSSYRTQEKKLSHWLTAPIITNLQEEDKTCYSTVGNVFHDRDTYNQNKYYLQTHPDSVIITSNPCPGDLPAYSTLGFVKMQTDRPRFDLTLLCAEPPVRAIGGGWGNDEPVGRAAISEGYFHQLRKRYNNSKHGIALSSRSIAAKTVTSSHRSALVSSWQPVNNCSSTS